jgi:hypothetical protein
MTALYGYDGNGYSVGDRVELHPGLDWWARGCRYGTVVGTRSTPQDRVIVVLDYRDGMRFSAPQDRFRRVG